MTPEEGESVYKLATHAAHDLAEVLTAISAACALMSENRGEIGMQLLILDVEASCLKGRHLIEQLMSDLHKVKTL